MTIQPFRQYPDLYHPANYKCGKCTLFKTSRCPNPEDLAVHNFQPGRWKDENSIACILIYQNYVGDVEKPEQLEFKLDQSLRRNIR